MDTLRAVCAQYWDIFVEYFCVVFEGMNQIVSTLYINKTRQDMLFLVDSLPTPHPNPLATLSASQ